MLITVAYYRAITGDTASSSSAVSARIEEAQGLLEEHLRRPLDSAERTEQCRLWSTTVYPAATPVTVCADGDIVLDGAAVILDDTGDIETVGTLSFVDVTYTGGWTSGTLPETLKQAIARVAHSLLTKKSQPMGARDFAVGDVRVTYPPSGGLGIVVLVPGITRLVKPWRRKRP